MEPKVATGRASFAESWPVPAPGMGGGPLAVSPSRAVQVAQLATSESLARVLTLGGNALQSVVPDFPPNEGYDPDGGGRVGSWQAGFVDANDQIAFTGERYAACVLEYGIGAVQQRAVFDWRAGSYQLPPCTFARVGVLPWGAWGAITGQAIRDLNTCAFAATISTGMCQARAPICSGTLLMDATLGTTRTLRVPAKTAAVEIRLRAGAGGYVEATEDGGGTPRLKRDVGALADYPSWGPMQWSTANGTNLRIFASVLGSWVDVQFFLSL